MPQLYVSFLQDWAYGKHKKQNIELHTVNGEQFIANSGSHHEYNTVAWIALMET